MPCFARAFVRLLCSCLYICTCVQMLHTLQHLYIYIYTHIHIHVCVQIYIDTFNLRKLGRMELSMQEQHESPPTLNPRTRLQAGRLKGPAPKYGTAEISQQGIQGSGFREGPKFRWISVSWDSTRKDP